MKTLKKSLALVLAVVMVVGVLAVSASAATFTDSDKVQYNEAVEVLSAIKVIDGIGDGSFAPTATLTREQGAAYVIRALLTRSVSDNLGASGVAFSDVPATWWSAGVVNEAAARGIINGIGDGSFAPSATLTGAQFAKMLLVAIGVEGEYTGANWYNNVVVAATKVKLADGITGINYNAGITREEAAQMAYNAINYSAKASTSQYVVKDGNDKVIYTGTDAITALLMSQSEADNKLTVETVSTGSIAYDTYGLKKTEETDAFGRPTVQVTDGKEHGVKVVVSDGTPTLTYTKETKLGTIASAVGATTSKSVTLKVYNNSKDASTTLSGDYTKGDETRIGGTGTLIEVYKTGTNTYAVVIVDTYVDKLTKSDIKKAVAATATTDAKKAYITVGDENLEYETDAFKADDVVLYTVADGKVQNVVKADYVSGSVTAVSKANSYIRVDGEQHGVAAHNPRTIEIGYTAGYDVTDDTYTYYLDNYGNIIMSELGDTATVSENLIYVIDTASKASKDSDGTDLFGTGATTTAAQAQAKVINMTTGEIEVVNIGVVKNTEGKFVYATKTGAASDREVKTSDTTANKPVTTGAGVYKYATLDDGSIVISSEKPQTKSVTIEKNKASVGAAVSEVATSSTVVTLVEYTTNKSGDITGATVTTITGIANFPQDAKTYNNAVVNTKNGRVTEIVVVTEKTATESVTYAVFKGEGEKTSAGTAYAFYVNGKTVEYVGADGFNTTLEKDKVYTIETTNGKLSKAEAPNVVIENKTVAVVDNTFFTVEGSSTAYYLTSSAVVVAEGDDYNTAELSAEDVVTAYGKDAEHIGFVVIAK